MPTLTRPARPGDPSGGLTVRTPEENVRADRSADGATWIAEPSRGSAVRAMLRKGWSAGASKAGPAPVAAVKTPARPPARRSRAVDLSVLDQSVAKLEAALATGAHDHQLAQLLAAEEAGKTRKGAVRVLQARQEAAG